MALHLDSPNTYFNKIIFLMEYHGTIVPFNIFKTDSKFEFII